MKYQKPEVCDMGCASELIASQQSKMTGLLEGPPHADQPAYDLDQ